MVNKKGSKKSTTEKSKEKSKEKSSHHSGLPKKYAKMGFKEGWAAYKKAKSKPSHKGLPKKYAKMGFKEGWAAYKKAKEEAAKAKTSASKPVSVAPASSSVSIAPKPSANTQTSTVKELPFANATAKPRASVSKKVEIPAADNSIDTMKIANERDIATDFALKIYEKFNQMIKSIVLFGSSAKHESTPSSDIDIIIIIDDVSIRWDEELVAWYREELRKIMASNPYVRSLHINTVKLSTWWEDLMRGDPIVINILRYGDTLVDYGGFFKPLRILLKEGKIKSTPESIYTLLQRAPVHLTRAKQSMLAVVDGLYWSMVDSAHAALIATHIMPASPEDIPAVLTENFVKTKILNKKYVEDYVEIHEVAKKIVHGEITSVKAQSLDEWFVKADEFLLTMAKLVDYSIENENK